MYETTNRNDRTAPGLLPPPSLFVSGGSEKAVVYCRGGGVRFLNPGIPSTAPFYTPVPPPQASPFDLSTRRQKKMVGGHCSLTKWGVNLPQNLLDTLPTLETHDQVQQGRRLACFDNAAGSLRAEHFVSPPFARVAARGRVVGFLIGALLRVLQSPHF